MFGCVLLFGGCWLCDNLAPSHKLPGTGHHMEMSAVPRKECILYHIFLSDTLSGPFTEYFSCLQETLHFCSCKGV